MPVILNLPQTVERLRKRLSELFNDWQAWANNGNPIGNSPPSAGEVLAADGSGGLEWIAGGGGGTVSVADSIDGDGSAGDPLTLVNDEATPGGSEVYGTDPAGTKGWYTLPEINGEDLEAAILADNPVAYWRLDDVTTAVDLGSSGSDLTYGANAVEQSAHLIPTDQEKYVYNAGLASSGASANVNPTGASPVSGSWTVCFVVKSAVVAGNTIKSMLALNNSAGGTSAIVIGIGNGSTTSGVTVFLDAQTIPIEIGGAAGGHPVPFKPVLIHVSKNAATKTISLYFNGCFVRSTTYTTEAATLMTNPLMTVGIGHANSWQGHTAIFYGAILSEARIAAHAKAAGLYAL